MLLVALSGTGMYAQQHASASNTTNRVGPQRNCGTGQLNEEFEKWIQPLIKEQEKVNAANRGTQTVYTIPVVFHVIHTGSAVGSSYNISDAQIISQITVLNEDYRRLNADTTATPSVFKPVAADCEVNFCLAHTDPNGNVTTGIERINRTTFGWTAPPYQKTYIDTAIKDQTIWNTNKYLNIWVVPDYYSGTSQLLGHATFPAGSGLTGLTGNFGTALDDGIVLWYRCVGRVGNLDPNYNKGRTATHEIGHWLGLRHIWGDANCGNDYCSDTPSQQTANFSCPSFPHVTSCTGNAPNGDQFMNYMDYCDDDCLNMFSANQKTRIQTVLINSPMRVQQRNSTACNTPTGIQQNESNLITKLYPNPANDMLNLVIANQLTGSNLNMRIISLVGTEISNANYNYSNDGSYKIDVNGLSQGFYFLEINTDYGQKIVKFQIAR